MKKVFITLAAAAFASAAFAQQTLFNAMDTGGYWGGSNAFGTVAANINEQGQVFGLAVANSSITGFDMDMLSGAGLTGTMAYNDIQIQVSFFSGFQSTYAGSGNEFNTPVYTQTFDLGANTLTNNAYYSLSGTPAAPFFQLTTPVAVSGSNIGVQFAFLADTGNGLAAATTLQTTWLIGATGPSVGSNSFQYPNLAWGESGGTNSSASIAQ